MAGQSANTSNRGFASMDQQKQREIASKGGRAAHQQGTAHEFTPEEARAAGRKGGLAVSRDRQHMSQIGREGGTARANRRASQMRLAENPAKENQAGERSEMTPEQESMKGSPTTQRPSDMSEGENSGNS
jgi:uncharacterized protein